MTPTATDKGTFSAAAARVLYNVADAWHPPRPVGPDRGICGAGDFDLAAAISDRADPQTVRELEFTLRCLEWLPRLSEGCFSWLPRHSRRAWLRRIESGNLPFLRKRVLKLRQWVDTTFRDLRDARGPDTDIAS